MDSYKRELQTTKDGSGTFYVPELDETYHSGHGAIQESKHVFIEKGLKFLHGKEEKVKILEVGFGTGLNAFLTYLEAEDQQWSVQHTAIEPYPISEEEVQALNYPDLLDARLHGTTFRAFHNASFEEWNEFGRTFKLKKLSEKLEEIEFDEDFDLVYFDAFAPNKQAEMWTGELFGKVFASLNKNGVLVTYCAKGEVRRNLQASGFEVERLEGPPGKREMLRAIKY